jgi:hypothetical protein
MDIEVQLLDLRRGDPANRVTIDLYINPSDGAVGRDERQGIKFARVYRDDADDMGVIRKTAIEEAQGILQNLCDNWGKPAPEKFSVLLKQTPEQRLEAQKEMKQRTETLLLLLKKGG